MHVDFVHLPEFPARFAEPLRRAVRGESAEWPATATADEIAAIDEHGMAPLLFHYSRVAAFRSAALDAAVAEPLRLQNLRGLLRAAAAHGVEPLILKGTALAYSVFPAPELRPRCDVDLLVDRTDFGSVRALMSELGYDETLTSGDELAVRQHSFGVFDSYGIRHLYDVHLDIANNAVVAETLPYRELRARAIALPAIAADALAPSRADALLHAAIHRVVHHHGSDRLIWLYDVHLLRSKMSRDEHRTFWTLAAEREVVAICRATATAAESWFGPIDGGAAEEFLDETAIARKEASAVFLESGRRYGDVVARDLAALPDWRSRMKRVRQLAFPPADFMLQSFGSRHRVALPVFYAWRAARGVARLFRRT